ncbi:MAG: hypothetical protein AAB473_03195 [Patescibacteria group bacterium]
MIMNRLLKNPLEGAPKPWKPWYGYLFGLVMLVCVGLYIFERATGGSMFSTEMTPAQRFNALLRQNPVVMQAEARKVTEPEPVQAPAEAPSNSPINGGEDIGEVAKKALEILNTEPTP